MRGVWLTTAVSILAGMAQGALPLEQRVLVVYNVNVPDSLAVANYYMARRGIPAANKCGISPAAITYVSAAEFDNTVKTPIRTCLNAIGPANILYIVLTYQTPYGRIGTDGNGYSVDQSIADIWDQYNPRLLYPYPDNPHPYFAGAQTQGDVYLPFVAFADYRAGPGALTLYSVWRLDAATAAIAQGLVDKAMQAEASGLSGQACFDRNRGDITMLYDGGYLATDWDLHNAAAFAAQAGFAVTEDPNDAEFGTSPAPLRCDNAALYSGWYSLNHYNDAFTWNPGAIGFHMDSASALDPRGGTNWSANALQRGITVTSGAVQEPFLEALPHPDGIFRNLFEGANVGDAFLRNTAYLKWMIINMGDPLYRPFPAGFPAFNQVTNPQTSLALNPAFVVGGASSSGTVMLAGPAPPGGVSVNLTSNNPNAASVPPTVMVAQGSRTATFPIATAVVTSDTYAEITASSSAISRVNTIGVVPLLGIVSVIPTSVSGPASVAGAAYLNDYAPSGGVLVSLTSSNPAVASVPASVIVSGGTVSANFNIAVSPVSTSTNVVISATYAGATQTTTLGVGPGGGNSFYVSPASLAFTYTAGSTPSPQSLVVSSTANNFNFTASTSAAWLSVTPMSGTTVAGLQVSVLAGLQAGSYTGSVTLSAAGVASVTVPVTANAIAACSYSINPAGQSFTSAGGTATVSVTAGPGCGWTTGGSVPWVNVTGGGNGNGSAAFTVAPNASTAARAGSISIAGQTFNVTQAGIAATGAPAAVFRDFQGGTRLTTFGSTALQNAGGVFGSDPGMQQKANGDTVVVERDNYGGFWINVYSASAQAWAGWIFAGGVLQGVPGVAVTADGTTWFAGRDSFGAYYMNSYSAGGAFGAWRGLGGVFATDPSMAAAPDGSVYLIARDNWGGMWSGRYIPGAGFQGWVFGGGITPGKPSAAAGSDNAVYVSMHDPSNGVWMGRVQGNTWSAWQPGGGVMSTDPQAASAGNLIYVAAVDASGGVWFNRFTTGLGNGWQGWTGVGGIMQSVSAAAQGSKLYLVAREAGGVLWWLDTTGGGWSYVGYTGVAVGQIAAGPH